MARVLIVEDEGMLLDMMCTYMRGAGHEVSGSKSYDEALSLCKVLSEVKVRKNLSWSPKDRY